jgi:hypothetical protein
MNSQDRLVYERFSKMAVAARPMEEPEHCLQVRPPSPRVPFYGFMGNVRYRQFLMALPQTENFRFRSGCRKECTLVRQTFHIPIWRTHRVGSSTIIGDIDTMRKAGLA